jgi:hypothetical protein
VPGSDGLTGAFFKKCWDIIKTDVMQVVHQFQNLHAAKLRWINSANTAILPKKDGTERISDYTPIALIHDIVKITAKVLFLQEPTTTFSM